MSANPSIPQLLTKSLIRRHYLPVGARTLDRWISAGTFPAPDLRLTGKALFWRREAVEAWIADRAQEGGAR